VSDPTLLALVLDDPLAPRVLAYWKARKLTFAQHTTELPQIAKMVQAVSLDAVKQTLERCELAELLCDGGISPLAEQWLSSVIGSRLGMRKPTKKA
jgi:hypothetical protein